MTTSTTESKSRDICTICQDDFIESQHENIRTLDCSHRFHNECIQKWIELRNLCPLCNQHIDKSRPIQSLTNDDMSLTFQAIGNFLEGDFVAGNREDLTNAIDVEFLDDDEATDFEVANLNLLTISKTHIDGMNYDEKIKQAIYLKVFDLYNTIKNQELHIFDKK
jgi:hypothetical protein